MLVLACMAITCAVVDAILEIRGINQSKYWLFSDDHKDDNPHINGLITFANALITFQVGSSLSLAMTL